MKNIICTLLCIIITPAICTAQEIGSDFGVITQEEIGLKECPFDKEANAIVLFDNAISNYNDDRNLITDHHIRIKILNEKGYENADVKIYYYRKDDFESINRLEAAITNVNADGSTTTEKVNSKSVYKKNADDRLGIITFTFPNVKAGSIIEYKYQSFMKHYGGLRDWYFQNYLPVIKSTYTFHVAPNLEFTYRVKKQEERVVNVKNSASEGKVYFEMNNIPGLDDEAYMDSREDYLQKVEFQLSGYNRNDGFGKKNYMTTWDEATKELLNDADFGVQIGKNIAGAKNFIDEVKNITSEKDKMKAVFNYVRNNISWNGLTGKYARDGVKEVWSKKKGTEGEINLLLINLLKEAGLEVCPMLVSERYNGRVDTDYPFIDQFNTEYACVTADGKKYYLNAAENFTPVNIIPKQILNTIAFLVSKKNGGLVKINGNAHSFSLYVNSNATINDSGVVTGETLLRSEGYCQMEKATAFKEMGQDKYINQFYADDNTKIADYTFINQLSDSLPGEETFKFREQLSSGGGYMYIPLNNFFGFDKNPFTSSSRFSDINFGYKRKINTYFSATLPPGYTIDALPQPVQLTTPDKDIVFGRTVEYNKEDNSVLCMFLIDFKKSLYTYDEYEILKQMYKKIFDFLKEPVVLKKK